ncbi:MAG: sulfurtransferase complex subunit TusB [Candidatus Lokiarchaeota archaeon]|nr:sulfurtransferase complex subunit TusB [Candidatus Lokiarchaeota archaeon]
MIMGKKALYFITTEKRSGIEMALENTEDEVTICLLQNAVFFANKADKQITKALDQNKTVIALKEDVEIRGLKNLIPDNVKLLDYGEVIDKIFEHDSIINM